MSSYPKSGATLRELKELIEGHEYECIFVKESGTDLYYRYAHPRAKITIRDGRIIKIRSAFEALGYHIHIDRN